MTYQNSKIIFIVVVYKTPKTETERLKGQIERMGKIRVIDNTRNNVGYAGAFNHGIKKGIKEGFDLFVVMNPDISIGEMTGNMLMAGARHFDIWGGAMKQKGKIYYGGQIDKWHMSGGLITKKPRRRFVAADFVSGSMMIVKKSVIERIGFLDEKYFMYYEDVDYCFRARQKKLKVGIDRDLIYEHFESRDNPGKEKQLNQSRMKFLLKYGNWQQKLYENIYRWRSALRKAIR